MLKNEKKNIEKDFSINIDELIKNYEGQNEALEKILEKLSSENITTNDSIKNDKK